jgi:ABC-type branched-subunit amino acid transport system ATPase component
VNLSEFEETIAVELPYGRKRALEIATTLALDPEMMLLDEPTAGMTHADVERIAALIKKVSANRTVLMVEHNLSVVSTLSDTDHRPAARRDPRRGDYQTVSKNPAGHRGLPRALAMLEVRGLNAWYGESHILHGMDFDVADGEVVTLLGRNGAGKTTTLQVDHGHGGPRQGSIKFRTRNWST